ncbi:MAG: hypothetical protein PWP23_1026 [Candidatus Sumerlaeota bacterium]|nr:hypothetical protein [Candidatus Sumerlaeota bacterium]
MKKLPSLQASSVNPLPGLAFLFTCHRALRERTVFVALLKRFWGSRYLLFAVGLYLAAICYSIAFNEFERFIFTKVFLPRGGIGGMMRVYSFATMPLHVYGIFPIVLGFLLRALIHSEFFRREVAASRLTPNELFRHLLAIVVLALLVFIFAMQLGHAFWESGIRQASVSEFLYSLFPHARPAPFGDYSVGLVILLEARDLCFRVLGNLFIGLPLIWVMTAVRRPALAVLAAVGAYVGLSLVSAPLEYLFLHLIGPPPIPSGWASAAHTGAYYLIYYVPRFVLLGVIVQFLRTRLFPLMLSRLPEEA